MVLVAHLSSQKGPQQLDQHSDNKQKLCLLSNKLAPPVVSSVSAPEPCVILIGTATVDNVHLTT